MNKISKYLLMLLLVSAATLAFTGCNGAGSGEVKPELVGTWMWNDYTRWAYILNEDGTGTRGIPGDVQHITWGVSGNTLHINREGDVPRDEIRNERWEFTLTDDQLFLNNRQTRGDSRSYYYTLAGVLGEVNQSLVGTWAWVEGVQWTYVFNEDGTGTRGWTGETDNFHWGVVDGVVRMEMQGALAAGMFRNEWWAYRIDDEVLRLESRHVAGYEMAYYYILDAGIGEANSALVGMWEWDEDYEWLYNFNADGTGTRGWYDELVEFTWGTEGNILRFLGWDGSTESWDFEIIDGMLRLESHQLGVVFYYYRAACCS